MAHASESYEVEIFDNPLNNTVPFPLRQVAFAGKIRKMNQPSVNRPSAYNNARKFYITAKKDEEIQSLLRQHLPPNVDIDVVLDSGGVWQDKTRITPATKHIKSGQTLKVYLCPNQGRRFYLDPDQIVFEDDAVLIVDKPPDVTSVPDRTNSRYNVTYGVGAYYANLGIDYWPTAITRLDFRVQGLMIFPKNKRIEKLLFKRMANRQIQKTYLALTEWTANQDREITIKDQLEFRGKTRPVKSGGRSAETIFFRVQEGENWVLFEIKPKTGRRHQIRAHAAHYLSPIIGDELYGSRWITPNQYIGLICAGYQFELAGKIYEMSHPTAKDTLLFLGNASKYVTPPLRN